MAQKPLISLSQIYKQFTSTFSPTDNPRDVVRFAKRRLSMDVKYGDVKKFLTNKKKWDERVCEPFDSEFGQDWFIETVQQSSCYQKWLIDCYFKQKHHTTCGLVSLGIVLNAKLLSNYYLSKYDPIEAEETDHEHYDEHDDGDDDDDDNKIEFDSDDEEDLDTLRESLPWLTESKLIHLFPQYTSRITIDKVLISGMNLDQLSQVFLDFGATSVRTEHCDHLNKENISLFRNLCRKTFSKHNMDIDKVIICNFDLWELQTGIEGGHISPIAAYHEESDRVLLLDTFTDESWVKIESLYKAMNTEHEKSGKYRGYILVSGVPVWKDKQNENSSSTEGIDTNSTTMMMMSENVNNNDDNNVINRRNDDRKKKILHRKANSSIDFDVVNFDFKQNYNDKHKEQQSTPQRITKQRSSRRMSKKLKLYIDFDDENGQNLWKETLSQSEYHQKFMVVEYFQQQRGTSRGGLVSMAIAFNARTLANHHHGDEVDNNDDDDDDKEYDEDDELFKLTEDKIIQIYQISFTKNTNKQLSLPKMSKILTNGMNLDEFGDILRVFSTKSVSVMHTYEFEMDQFRNLVKDVLKEGSQTNNKILFVNYDLLLLGTGIAMDHISPIVGYNEKNDMVLLMNVFWMLGKCWVSVPLLYEAMNTIADDAGKYRGCVIAEGLPLLQEE